PGALPCWHAEGRVERIGADGLAATTEDVATLRARCPHRVSGDEVRAACAAAGLRLGPRMSALREAWRGEGEVVARLELEERAAANFEIPPALLDGAFQSVAAFGDGDAPGVPVPFLIEEIELHAKLPARCWAHVT